MNSTRKSTETPTSLSIQWRPHARLRRDVRKSTESAATHLEIARLLLDYGRTDIARRRLERVVKKFANTPAAAESRDLLAAIEVASTQPDAPHPDRAIESG